MGIFPYVIAKVCIGLFFDIHLFLLILQQNYKRNGKSKNPIHQKGNYI